MAKEHDQIINAFLAQKGLDNLNVQGVGEGMGGGTKTVEFRSKKSIDQEILNRALRSNDDTSFVLLLSLEIEQQTAFFIESMLNEDAINVENFSTLCQMLRVFRFDNDIYKIVNGFRKLRNKFAHNKDASLDKHRSLLDEIFSFEPPSPTMDKIEYISDEGGRYKISDLPNREKLYAYANLCVIFLAVAPEIYEFGKPRKRIEIKFNGEKG